MKSSGIGGQAVLEGVMMRNKENIAVAVRKPDGSIEVGYQKTKSPAANHKILGLPIIRGVVSFIYSLVLGIKTLSFSADFYEDEEETAKTDIKKKAGAVKEAEAAQAQPEAETQPAGAEMQPAGQMPAAQPSAENETQAESSVNEAAAKLFESEEKKEKNSGKVTKTKIEEKETSKGEKALLGVSMVLGLCIAIVLFFFLPYWISALIVKLTGLQSATVLAIIEGIIKLAIFIAYVWAISFMQDIKRTFMYHGAEHKCINCIESGKELTVENVMASSKEHRRCGTSFVFFVLIISIIFFIFIRVDNTWLRMLIRLLLIPVIAGVSFEFIQWAGNSDSKAAAVLSRPGLWVQALTTREPTADMAEVGIASVEAVFDWRGYLKEQGYEVSEAKTDAASD